MLAVAAAASLAAGCSAGSGTGEPTPASVAATASERATSSGTVTAAGGTSYDLYVALGDSLAAGYQPTNAGDPRDEAGGYAGLVRAGLPQPEPPELVNLGCPGETTTTMAEGGRCSYPEGSQLRAAETLLRGLPGDGERALVSLHVGANDVQRCVDRGGATPRVDEECVARGLATVRDRLPDVLARLRSAAPRARLVVVDYYNPFVVAALLGAPSRAFAVRTAEVQEQLNEIVAEAARDAGADVATVAAAFGQGRQSGSATPAVGPICSVTWMCADPPDIHPTDAGYALIAGEVLEAVTGTR